MYNLIVPLTNMLYSYFIRTKFLCCALVFITLGLSNVMGQSVLDSLQNALKNAKEPSVKSDILVQLARYSQDREQALDFSKQAFTLAQNSNQKSSAQNQIAWSFKNLFQFDSARKYAHSALDFALKNNDPLIVSDVYNTYGSIQNNLNNYDSALYFYNKALEYRSKTDDLAAQAVSMNNISIVLQRLGKFDESVIYIDKSIAIYEQLDMRRSAADSYLNKGNLLNNSGDLDSAYVSFQNALRAYESLDLQVMMTYALINMSTVALDLNKVDDALKGFKQSEDILIRNDGNAQLFAFTYNGLGVVYNEHFDMPDSAIYYLNKGGQFAREAESKYLLSISENNLGTAYRKLGKPDEAIQHFELALKLKTEMGELSGLSTVNIHLGEIYSDLQKNTLAEKYLKEGLRLAEEVGDMGYRVKAYTAWYEFAKKTGDFRASLSYLEKSGVVKDSLLNAEHLEKVAELNTQYETEKKEQQIALQQAQLTEQDLKLQRNRLLLAGLIVVAILLAIIILLIRNKARKKEQLLKQESELKLREAELNAVINSQEKERNRFARDLHDGFGQLISVLKLNISSLKDSDASKPEKRMEVFKNGESVINDMYQELRSICFDLMPQTLVKKGLTIALREFGDRINQSRKVGCDVMVFSNKERLPEIVEISLFRISQEWVNNILKYAEASHITIQLTRDTEELTLTIEDDGNGFDVQDFYQGKGNGWRNIQTRLNLIKAEFDLDTTPGRKGTLMTVNVANTTVKNIPTSTERQITSS